MSQEKPKYIRKHCEHGKYAFQCKDCKGSCICIHEKVKSICKECNGSTICIHRKIKNQCKDCGGASICEHNKRRSRCIECKGGSICIHSKLKSRCKDCNGNELCEHQKRKEHCIECQGSSICTHQLRKSRCAECNGTEICSHGNNKYICIPCGGENVCEHKKLHYQCTECKGRLTCEHDKRRAVCIICTPSSACQHCKSISIIGSRWKPYCFRCYCVLHPDAKIPRKYKLKEHLVRDKLIEEFKDSITMRFDKIVEGGCSNRRPDISIDFGSHCLMIEIDENQHMNYTCEQQRMQELYEDIGFRKIVFLRFNPDGYQEGNKKYRCPFGYRITGAIHIQTKEFNRRMNTLLDRIHAHQKVEPIEQLTVEYLFYSV